MPDFEKTTLQQEGEALLLYVSSHMESLESLTSQAEALRALLSRSEGKTAEAIRSKLQRLESLSAIFEKHTGLKEKLQELNELTAELSAPGPDGLLPLMTPKRCRDLFNSYGKVYNQLLEMQETVKQTALIADPGTRDTLTALSGLTAKLRGTLARDFQVLRHYEASKTTLTLPQLLDVSRVNTVNLGSRKLKSVGDVSSVRIPFKFRDSFGTLRSGFFTEKNSVSLDVGFLTLLDELKAKKDPLAGMMEHFLNHALEKYAPRNDKKQPLTGESLKHTAVMSLFRTLLNKKGYLDAEKLKSELSQCCRSYAPALRGDVPAPETVSEIKALTKLFKDRFDEKVYDCEGHIMDARVHGARMDTRNSAMSVMADLLGKPQLLAYSAPMKIIHNGRLIEGTFMEEAIGIDPSHPPLYNSSYKAENLNSPDGLRSMADLQVLDILCANTDRHERNMFYSFDRQSDDVTKHRLTGVQGIDNDNSFGAMHITNRDNGHGMTAWNDMRVMSQSMANAISALTPAALSYTLQGLELSEAELQAAISRLKSIKNFMAEDAQYFDTLRREKDRLEQEAGKRPLTEEESKKLELHRRVLNHEVLPRNRVSIIPDDEFHKLDLKKLCQLNLPNDTRKRQNIFSTAMKMPAALTNARVTPISPLELEDASRVNSHAVEKDLKQASKMLRRLQQGTKAGKQVSAQYTALQNGLQSYVDFCEQQQGFPMTRESHEARNQQLRELQGLAEAYLEYKQHDGLHSMYARSRINLVKDISRELSQAVFTPTEKEFAVMDHFATLSRSELKRRSTSGQQAEALKNARESLKEAPGTEKKPAEAPQLKTTKPDSSRSGPSRKRSNSFSVPGK